MSEAEKLMADVPARDPRFELGVMAKIEQRRFRRELMRTGLVMAAVMILLAVAMPKLDSLIALLLDVSLLNALSRQYGGVLALVLMVVTIMLPRLSRARARDAP
jgi:uncharacterized integral membrane protein